jgi:serine/threonine-protein kinase
MVAPWSKSNNEPTPQTGAEKAINAIVLTILLGIPTVAVVLSLRNLRLGRMDARGATRLAVAGGSVVLLAAALGSNAPVGASWVLNSFMIASWAAFSALLIWTFYAAVEPYVRRHWPQMLISWSRLLDGRWRDPLVGRDLLIGCVLGLALMQLNMAQIVIERWQGQPPPLRMPETNAWMGLRPTVATVISNLPTAVWVALGMVLLLVVLRLLLRREWAAAIGFVVILVAPSLLDRSTTLVGSLFQVASAVIFAIIATRFGLVMFAGFLLTIQILGRSGGFGEPAFAMGAMFMGLAAAAAPGVFGFFTATRGRKGTAWLDG